MPFAVMPSTASAPSLSGAATARRVAFGNEVCVTTANAAPPMAVVGTLRMVSGSRHGRVVRHRKGRDAPLRCAASGSTKSSTGGPERNAIEHALHLKYGALSSASTSYNKDAPLPQCDVIGLGQAMVDFAATCDDELLDEFNLSKGKRTCVPGAPRDRDEPVLGVSVWPASCMRRRAGHACTPCRLHAEVLSASRMGG